MSFATSARGGESGAGPLEAGGAAAAKTSRGMARKRAGDGEVERASGRGVGSTRGRCAVANSDATRPRRSPETLVSGKTIPRRNHERPLVQSGAREFPRRFQSPWQPGDRLTSGVREKDLEDLNRVCGKKICFYYHTWRIDVSGYGGRAHGLLCRDEAPRIQVAWLFEALRGEPTDGNRTAWQ